MPEIKVEWSEGDEAWLKEKHLRFDVIDDVRWALETERSRCISIVQEVARERWLEGTAGWGEIIQRIAKGR